MHNTHNLHLLHYDVADKKDLYYHTALRIMGVQLVGVFIPALLYHNLGIALSGILLFYALRSLGIVALVYTVSAKLVSKRGTKIAMFIGIPFLAMFLLGLHLLDGMPRLLYVLPFFGSIFVSFFWIGFHTDISEYAHNRTFGSKLALLHILITIVGAVTPFIGGVLLDNVGMLITLYIGASLLLISLVPLLHTEHWHEPKEFKSAKLKNLFKNHKGLAALGTFAAETYMKLLAGTIRPLAMFILLGSYTKLGLITMIATLVVVLLLYIAGRYADRHQEDKVMLVNLSLQATNWIVAIGLIASSFISIVGLSIIELFNKLTLQLNGTMISKAFYEFADDTKENPVYITSLHEISCHIAKTVFCFFFAGLFWLLGDQERLLFLPFLLGVLIVPFQYLLFKVPAENGSDASS